MIAVSVLLGCAGVIGVAAWLTPSDRGIGTHRQMGLPACGLYSVTGWPCPTCGMTTAFSHVAHGQLLSALRVQPAGALFAVGVVVASVVAVYVLITGRSIGAWLAWNVTPLRIGMMVVGLIVMGWAYKAAAVYWYDDDRPSRTMQRSAPTPTAPARAESREALPAHVTLSPGTATDLH